DDERLGPPADLESMVDRRHAKKATPTRHPEVGHLQDCRTGIEHEDKADDWQEYAPPRLNRDDRQRGAEGQSSGVAHENHCRIGVVPEKAKESSGDDRREY